MTAHFDLMLQHDISSTKQDDYQKIVQNSTQNTNNEASIYGKLDSPSSKINWNQVTLESPGIFDHPSSMTMQHKKKKAQKTVKRKKDLHLRKKLGQKF